jgi:hypothetical protein
LLSKGQAGYSPYVTAAAQDKNTRRRKMKSFVLSLAALGAFSVAASAESVKLSKGQMDQVVAGAITTTTTQTNGGGKTPHGTANGVPTTTTSTNPAGSAPPGQNK